VNEDELLAQWIEEGDAIVRRVNAGAGAGVARFADLASMTGLEVMQAMLRGEMPVANMAETLTFGAISVGPGTAVFQGTPEERFLNPMGTVHGGWMSTLLDSALGSAVMTALPPGAAYLTASLSVNYLRPLTLGTKRVRVDAHVAGFELERNSAKAHGILYGPDGMQYATATGQFKVIAKRRAVASSSQRKSVWNDDGKTSAAA